MCVPIVSHLKGSSETHRRTGDILNMFVQKHQSLLPAKVRQWLEWFLDKGNCFTLNYPLKCFTANLRHLGFRDHRLNIMIKQNQAWSVTGNFHMF